MITDSGDASDNGRVKSEKSDDYDSLFYTEGIYVESWSVLRAEQQQEKRPKKGAHNTQEKVGSIHKVTGE